jgi:hypothetical protein
MPPHACMKSPVSSDFSEDTHGEWSETTYEICQWIAITASATQCKNIKFDSCYWTENHLVIQKRGPELLSIPSLPDRRTALEFAPPITHVLALETKIVEARLGRKFPSVLFRPPQDGQRVRSRQVHDVRAQIRVLSTEVRDELDRSRLGSLRTRGKESLVAARGLPVVVLRLGKVFFGVEHEESAGSGEDGHCAGDVGCADVRKLVDARRREKTFEAAHASMDEREQVFLCKESAMYFFSFFSQTDLVARDHSAPESHISPTLALCRLSLYL